MFEVSESYSFRNSQVKQANQKYQTSQEFRMLSRSLSDCKSPVPLHTDPVPPSINQYQPILLLLGDYRVLHSLPRVLFVRFCLMSTCQNNQILVTEKKSIKVLVYHTQPCKRRKRQMCISDTLEHVMEVVKYYVAHFFHCQVAGGSPIFVKKISIKKFGLRGPKTPNPLPTKKLLSSI